MDGTVAYLRIVVGVVVNYDEVVTNREEFGGGRYTVKGHTGSVGVGWK